VDLAKGTITLNVFSGKKGGDGEDRTFTVTKATQIVTEVYGVPVKLADVRVDKDAILRLSMDQKGVARLTIVGE